MAIFDEIKRMRDEGKSEQDMGLILQEEGHGMKEISDALAQSKIKEAVSSPQDRTVMAPYGSQEQDMVQSISNQSEIPIASKDRNNGPPPEQVSLQQAQSQQAQQMQAQMQIMQQMQPYTEEAYSQQYAPYQQYESYGQDAETIAEISEQILAEKLSSIRGQLEAILDLKNTTEAKLLSMDERLKKIEKIIDRLQLSILQKVGEYVTNVEDIKKEMQETQKSFKSLLNAKEATEKANYKELE